MNHVINVYEPGGPDVLRYEQASVGKPGTGQVRLRQTAIGLNYLDIYFRRGEAQPPAYPFIPGTEAAGIIEDVGEGVDGLKPGQRVAYQLVLGSYAEVRVMPADRLVKIPDTIDDQTAAAMMLKGMTAEYLVRRTYPVKPGDTVLIHAAAGGVGLLLCQWASHRGATVIGTVSSPAKADLIRANGCEYPILYTQEDFVERVQEITHGQGVNVVYDGVGKSTFAKSLDVLKPFGLGVLFGWASGRVDPIDIHTLNKNSLSVTNPSLGTYTGSRELLEESAKALFEAVDKKIIKIPVNQTYALRDVQQAHQDLEARKTTGSTVLIP